MMTSGTGSVFGNPLEASLAAQARAKSLLLRLGDNTEGVKFTFSALAIQQGLTLESFEIESNALDHEVGEERFEQRARAAAELWESLAYLPEIDPQSARLNAAVSYEIAGFQANALCIANLLEREGRLDPISKIIIEFLRRRFRNGQRLASEMARNPRTGWGESIPQEYMLCSALVAQGIRRTMRGLMRGDSSWRELSEKDFSNAEAVALKFGLADAAGLVRSLRALLPVIETRSTWSAFKSELINEPRWRRYLTLLARGSAGRVKLSDTSIVELWPSQLKALQSGFLGSGENLLIRMPTSSGKTRIAEMGIVRELLRDESAKCAYIAPYRALVSEVAGALGSVLGDLGYKVSALVETSSDISAFEEDVIERTSVFVTTPERLDLIIRARPDLARLTKLIVIDEGHVLAELERGLRFELFVTRVLRTFKNARLLFLSAVISEQSLDDISVWLKVGSQGKLSSEWRPTRQKVAMLLWDGRKGRLQYAKDDSDDIIDQFVPSVIEIIDYSETSKKTGRALPRQFPDRSKAEIAAALAFKLSELGPVLIFASQRNHAEAVARAMTKRIDIERENQATIPSYFAPKPTFKSLFLARDVYPEAVSWLSKGVAVHHRTLPEPLKAAIEEDFRARHFRVIVATSTLAQGVNFPVRSVIFHTTARHDEEEDRQVDLAARDYWNIAGRAGRAGEETESLIVHVCTNVSDVRKYKGYLRRRHDVEPLRSALLNALEQLMDERLASPRLEMILDSQLLAILCEETLFGVNISEVCASTMEVSLAKVQALREGTNIPKLTAQLEKVAIAAVAGVKDARMLRAFAGTGLSSTSCHSLLKFIDQESELCERVALDGGPSDCRSVLSSLLKTTLPEAEPEVDFAGDSVELLEQWLNGLPLAELMPSVDGTSFEVGKLARYVEDAFSAKLSWVANALLILLCYRLNIERSELAIGAQYLPATVRLGVPNAESCWALSLGIPLRSLAARVANGYLDSEERVHNLRDFTSWYQSLDATDFLSLGLPVEFLEDIAQGKAAATANALAHSVGRIEDVFPYRLQVRSVGESDLRLPEETVLQVERDPDNPIDRNSVLFRVRGKDVAKVPIELAQLVAPEIDVGTRFAGVVLKSDKAALDIEMRIVPQMTLF